MNMQVAAPAESLDKECRMAQELVELLKREQAQLIRADIHSLPELTEAKAGLVGQMSSLAMHRHQRLAVAGFPSNESGMEEWVKSPAAKGDARQSWEQLLSLAESAKELNRVNGLLIGKHLVRTQGALNALNAGASGGNFYGPDGQSMSKPGSRGLAIG
jgi:flagella synthesis protein FlgN